MQTGNFLYAPRWVKVSALVVLSFALLIALVVVIYYVRLDGNDSLILVAVSLGQVAASGLVIALIVFFSQRDADLKLLRMRIQDFLLVAFPKGLAALDCADPKEVEWRPGQGAKLRDLLRQPMESNVTMRLRYVPDSVGCWYLVTARGRELTLHAQVNVGEVILSLYLPARDSSEFETMRENMRWGLSRLEGVSGYRVDWHYSTESFDGRPYAIAFLTKDFGLDFLDDNRRQLFVINDLTLNLRGLMNDAIKKDYPLSYRDLEVLEKG